MNDTTIIDAKFGDVIAIDKDEDGDIGVTVRPNGGREHFYWVEPDNAIGLYNALGDRLGLGRAPSPVPQKSKWEEVTVDPKGAGHTYRLRIPGGHLYRTVSYVPGGEVVMAQSTVFVPASEISNDVDFPNAVEV